MTVALLYRYTRTKIKHPEEYYTRSDWLRLAVYLAFNIMVHCCILSLNIFLILRREGGERERPDSF